MSKKAFRFRIEGNRTEWVQFPSQAQTLADGRVRRTGLTLQGPDGEPVALNIDLDIARGEIDGNGFTVKIANTDGHAADEFSHLAEVKNWITDTVTTQAGIIPVASSAGFTSLSVVHVGTEAFSVTSVTDAGLHVDQRGYWDTITQVHYTDTGANLRTGEVIDRPQTIEGRRCFLYEYAAGDDRQGDGTLIWRGVCATDAKFDGTSFNILVDPITVLLKRGLGRELEDPVRLRGIYYHDLMAHGGSWNFAGQFKIAIGNYDGPSIDDSETSLVGVGVSDLPSFDSDNREVFYETQEDFCEDVNAAISSAIASFSPQPEILRLVPDGHRGYNVLFRPGVDGGGTPHNVSFELESSIDGAVFGGLEKGKDGWWTGTKAYEGDKTVSEGTNYSGWLTSGLMTAAAAPEAQSGVRTVPRAAWKAWDGDGNKLYLSGIIPISSRFKEIHIGSEDQDTIIAEVLESSTSERWIRAKTDAVISNFGPEGSDNSSGSGLVHFTSANNPEIQLTRSYSARNVAEIVDEITDDAPAEVNRGGGPGLYDEDVNQIEMTALMFNKIFHELRIAQRRYTFATEVHVDELLAHEFRLIGAYPTVDEDHKLTMRVLEVPSGTDPDLVSLAASEILIDEDFPEWEKHSQGMLDRAVLKTRYDPLKDNHIGPTYQVHNVRATSRNHNAKTLKIEPKSVQLAADSFEVTYDEAALSLGPVLGLFGAPYATVRVTAKAETSADLVRVGNPVAISHHAIPNWQSGTLGVTDLPGIVIGRTYEPTRGRVTYKILTTGIDIAGYAPSLGVTSQTNVQDSIWNVNVRLGDPLGITDWSDTSKYDASDFYEPGYQIRVKKWNSSTVNPVAGTVNTVDGNTLVIDFDSTWTPGSDLWTVEFENADEATSGQQAYAYFAGSDRRIDFSQPRKAREFAP